MPFINREGKKSNNRDRSSLEALSNRWTFLTQDGPEICCYMFDRKQRGKIKKLYDHAMENGILML